MELKLIPMLFAVALQYVSLVAHRQPSTSAASRLTPQIHWLLHGRYSVNQWNMLYNLQIAQMHICPIILKPFSYGILDISLDAVWLRGPNQSIVNDLQLGRNA